MKKTAFKILSWIVLSVFVLGTMPKEYLHKLIANHVDTVHRVYKKGEFGYSNKHIHCGFVGFVFAPHVPSQKQFLSFPEIPLHSCKYILPVYCFHHCLVFTSVDSRGPPALI